MADSDGSPADPHEFTPWDDRSHEELACLVRELLLAGHLIDRSGMPHLISEFGRQGMSDVAIAEWSAASPIYTRRMQRLLRFEGDTVESIFKGMQIDIGAPPEFMDFRYEVESENRGSFFLAHCGALMDVEPMGEDYVVSMCHHIEDPTFDATAAASNPRAQVRPVHRPPRHPVDRQPHCSWTVTIDEQHAPAPMPPQAIALMESKAALTPLPTPGGRLSAGDGRTDYAGPLDTTLRMESFSSSTLATIADEVALQGQLLSRAFMVEVAHLGGPETARSIGARQAVGIAGLTARRLRSALGVDADIAGVREVLAVHPLFLPRSYVEFGLAEDADGLVVSIGDCTALEEPDGLTWTSLTVAPPGDRILASAVQAVAPRATVKRVPTSSGDGAAWLVRLDSDEPCSVPDEVVLAEFSTGAGFSFGDRRP